MSSSSLSGTTKSVFSRVYLSAAGGRTVSVGASWAPRKQVLGRWAQVEAKLFLNLYIENRWVGGWLYSPQHSRKCYLEAKAEQGKWILHSRSYIGIDVEFKWSSKKDMLILRISGGEERGEPVVSCWLLLGLFSRLLVRFQTILMRDEDASELFATLDGRINELAIAAFIPMAKERAQSGAPQTLYSLSAATGWVLQVYNILSSSSANPRILRRRRLYQSLMGSGGGRRRERRRPM